MKFTFVYLTDAISVDQFKSIKLALDNYHEYELVSYDDYLDATGDYVFWVDVSYNPIALRKTCDYIAANPPADLYYPWYILNSASGEVLSNGMFNVRENCPLGIIVSTTLLKSIGYRPIIDDVIMRVSGSTINVSGIEPKLPLGIPKITPFKSGVNMSLGEHVASLEWLREVTPINGRTWGMIDRRIEVHRRAGLVELEKVQKLLPTQGYTKIYNKLLGVNNANNN